MLDAASGRHFVYAVFCRDADGPMYVKIGISSDVVKRLTSLNTASPIAPVRFSVVEAASSRQQRAVERELHERFAKYHSNGEWFRFDASKTDTWDEFHAGCWQCFRRHRIKRPTWYTLSAEAFKDHGRQRKKKAKARRKRRRDPRQKAKFY